MTLNEITKEAMSQLSDANEDKLSFADYKASIKRGILEYSKYSPRRVKASITLETEKFEYSAPSGILVKSPNFLILWGKDRARVMPWNLGNASGQIERFSVPEMIVADGSLMLLPKPSASHIAVYGSTFEYVYSSVHTIDTTSSTVPEHDEELVILSALSEICKRIAAMGDQSEAFVKRYYTLAKRYRERFLELTGTKACLLKG